MSTPITSTVILNSKQVLDGILDKHSNGPNLKILLSNILNLAKQEGMIEVYKALSDEVKAGKFPSITNDTSEL